MKKTARIAVLGLLLSGCASTPNPDAADGAVTASSTADATSAPTSDPTSAPTGTTAATAGPTSTAAPSSTASAPALFEEVAKDPNALVLDITVESSADDKAELLLALHKSIAKVPDIGVPTSKGITGNRHVTAKLILPAVVETKDGYTQKAKFVGITTDGKCPLFDLDASSTLSTTGPKGPNDVVDVRADAVNKVFEKLAAKAKTIKPNASCTSEKAWK